MGTNARRHAKGLVREGSRQRVPPANSKCLINTRWLWVLVVWPRLLIRAPGLGRSSSQMVAKRKLEPWFFPPQLWSTDGSAVSMDPGGSRVKVEQAWWQGPLRQPVWGDTGFPAMWLLLHGDTDHAYSPRGKLEGPRGHGERQTFCSFERLSPASLPGSSLESRHDFVPSWSRLLQGRGVRVQTWNQGHPMTNFRVPVPHLWGCASSLPSPHNLPLWAINPMARSPCFSPVSWRGWETREEMTQGERWLWVMSHHFLVWTVPAEVRVVLPTAGRRAELQRG